jgi:ADP-ribose pyrophosphatase YjhB (NUDIX family)
MPKSVAKYCELCAGALEKRVPVNDLKERLVCVVCDHILYAGPSVLVVVLIFSQGQMLLVKRGTFPYKDKWAPPGGFVEADESLETAAVREVHEEVGITLTRDQLLPHAMFSLPALNQISACFLVVLDRPETPRPAPPEAQEARWFTEADYPAEEMWGPDIGFKIGPVFDKVRTGRFDFYQQTDDALRVISGNGEIHYLWRRP